MLVFLATILCITEIAGETFKTRNNQEITHRVGYVGPACAVVV